jgi:hypothetical protein
MLGNTWEMVQDDAKETISHAKEMFKSIKKAFMCLIFGHADFECYESPFCGRCFANFSFTQEMNEAETDEEFYSAMLVFKRLYKKQAE